MAGPAASSRPRTAWLRYLGWLAAIAPVEAFAGAWVAPEGGQQIISEAAGVRDEVYYGETAAFLEIPASPQSSIVLSTWLQNGAGAGPRDWLADTSLGWKRALVRTDDSAMAVQVSAVWSTEPGDQCSEGGAEARWMGGRNFGEDGRTFVNLEVAGRAMVGGCESARLDLTAGYKPNAHWLGMAQIFTHDTAWSEDGRDSTVQAQLSLVRFTSETRGFQIGVRARLDGEDAGPMLVFGFWGQPSK